MDASRAPSRKSARLRRRCRRRLTAACAGILGRIAHADRGAEWRADRLSAVAGRGIPYCGQVSAASRKSRAACRSFSRNERQPRHWRKARRSIEETASAVPGNCTTAARPAKSPPRPPNTRAKVRRSWDAPASRWRRHRRQQEHRRDGRADRFDRVPDQPAGLNAAVESRARGRSGPRFAVVPNEVRSLASACLVVQNSAS